MFLFDSHHNKFFLQSIQKDKMKSVTVTKLRRNFSQIMKLAQKEDVYLTKYNKVILVLIGYERYKNYTNSCSEDCLDLFGSLRDDEGIEEPEDLPLEKEDFSV